MALQTVVIRIGGLTFGSSEFTFAMVVAAFVLSIAAGSLVVSALPGIGRAVLPAVLWALALAFALLYLRADEAPHWGHVLRTFFTSQEQTFHVFFGAAFLATLCVIGPAVALSGAVLPLIFDAQRDEIGDLGGVAGRIYSQNTIGSLLGALIGGYALLFWLDLHHVARIALAALALAAALVTAHRYFAGNRGAAAAMFGTAVIAVVSLPAWDPGRLSSGLFRVREAQPGTFFGPGPKHRPVDFHDDDPTSTVAAGHGDDGGEWISVNGKPDGNTARDLHTMALAALIPALFADDAERAFVIGFGTGITAGYLAGLDTMHEVTVAEISAGVLGAAPLFDFANNGASHHPKIRRIRSDAYRALLRSGERYDVIVSEPSNPWAAGIEMLFSREFLAAARERLAPGGVYVQWYHLYENNDRAVRLVLATYAEAFDRVAVWRSQAGDLLLFGFPAGTGALDLDRIERRMERPDLRAALARVGIHALPDLLVHEVLPLGVVHADARAPLPTHSLFHPRLSYEAGRGFFVGREGRLPFFGSGTAAEVGRSESLLRRYLDRYRDGIPEAVWSAMIGRACRVKLPHCPNLIAAWAARHAPAEIQARLAELRSGRDAQMRLDLLPALRHFYGDPSAEYPGAPPDELAAVTRTYFERYYAALPFPPQRLVALWQRCQPSGGTDATCQQGLQLAQSYAATGVLPPAWREEAGVL
jgi:spermidine synthase